MELEQLRVFAAVADEGSFTGAARRLYISHSTVSRTVTALEEELGVRLVERDNRFIALTKAGAVLREEAESLLSAASTAAARVKAVGEKNAEAGEIIARTYGSL